MSTADFTIRLCGDHTLLREGIRPNRPLTWPISVEIGALRFPSAEWSDFAIVILGWWVEKATSLLAGESAEATFRFMEGPYELSLKVAGEDYWEIVPVIRGQSTQQAEVGGVRGSQVASELRSAAINALNICKAIGRWDKDCESLAALVRYSA